jgi:predicted AAA+ superfamily ATPase
MISKETLKEIIVSNQEFILKQVTKTVERERISFPEPLKKTVVLYGVRRSGKTFILFDVFKKFSDRSLYIDFEDERLTGFQLNDFEKLRESFLELHPDLSGKGTVFLLDEVQNVAGWEKFCRRAVERENISVFVSGSSSKMMPSEIHTELRGRSWSIEILPFSFKEYLAAMDLNIKDNSLMYGNGKTLLKKHFSEFIKWGGFPEAALLKTDFEKTKLIKEYMSAMYFRDLVERYNITNIHLLENLTDKLFSSFSTKFSLTAFYKQYKDKFPFSKDLLFRYYKHFLQSMLVFEVRKFAESTYKRMRNPAKVYLIDTGLCRKVTSADAGRSLENIIGLELKRRGYEIFYFEDKRECDFIVKSEDGTLSPIQAAYELTEANEGREIDGLTDACRHLGTDKGTIFTYDEERDLTRDGISIKIMPVWKWCLESMG